MTNRISIMAVRLCPNLNHIKSTWTTSIALTILSRVQRRRFLATCLLQRRRWRSTCKFLMTYTLLSFIYQCRSLLVLIGQKNFRLLKILAYWSNLLQVKWKFAKVSTGSRIKKFGKIRNYNHSHWIKVQ